MKRLVTILVVVFLLISFVFAVDLNPTFKKVKQVSMTAEKNENGHYFKYIKIEDTTYYCGYLPEKGCVGVVKQEGDVAIVVEVVEGQYGASIIQRGVIVFQEIISEEEAVKFAEQVLEKFKTKI